MRGCYRFQITERRATPPIRFPREEGIGGRKEKDARGANTKRGDVIVSE